MQSSDVPATKTLRCPDHPCELTPAAARLLAMELVQRADEAEGGRNILGFVTRWEVLVELHQLRDAVARLEAVS